MSIIINIKYFQIVRLCFKFELYSFPVCGREDENKQAEKRSEWCLYELCNKETKTVFLCFNSLTSLFWSEMIEAFNISVCVIVQSAVR